MKHELDSINSSEGNYSKLASSGERAVLVSAERDCKVKGSLGTLICLCHYDNKAVPIKLVAGKIGEEGLKPDIWYELDKEGHFKESI
jgi:hypothetical protein